MAGASSLVCIGAGFYLLLSNTVAPNSYLQTIAHGIGVYFIGKGLYVGPALWKQDAQLNLLRWALHRHFGFKPPSDEELREALELKSR